MSLLLLPSRSKASKDHGCPEVHHAFPPSTLATIMKSKESLSMQQCLDAVILCKHSSCSSYGTQEDEALDVLRIVSKGLTKAKLKALNISDNALGEKGVRACADVITGQVRHWGCSSAGRALAGSLAADMLHAGGCNKIQHVCMCTTASSAAGCQAGTHASLLLPCCRPAWRSCPCRTWAAPSLPARQWRS